VGIQDGSDREDSSGEEEVVVVEVDVGDGHDADWEMMKEAWQVLGNMNQTVIAILILNAVDDPGNETENVSVTFDHPVCYIR
jgi:hypothetical protein